MYSHKSYFTLFLSFNGFWWGNEGMHVCLTFFSAIKVKLAGLKGAKYLFMCYLTCQDQNLIPAAVSRFLIPTKIQAAPPPIKYSSSCWEDQKLSTKGKIVSIYRNISRTLGRGFAPHPPLWFCLYVWGLKFDASKIMAGNDKTKVLYRNFSKALYSY